MNRFEFVYFDLDDTLLDHRSAERQALADVFETYSHAFGSVSLESFRGWYREINDDVWHRYGDGEITKADVKRERFERLLEASSPSKRVSARAMNDLYIERYSHYWSYVPGARESFETVASMLPVGILTNGFREVQHRKLDRFNELREASHAIVISEETGFMKPDSRIFARAAECAGVAAERLLYVGDSYRSDVCGAINAGWKACWFRAQNDHATILQRSDFDDEIPDAVGMSQGPDGGQSAPRFSRWPDVLSWLGLFDQGAASKRKNVQTKKAAPREQLLLFPDA